MQGGGWEGVGGGTSGRGSTATAGGWAHAWESGVPWARVQPGRAVGCGWDSPARLRQQLGPRIGRAQQQLGPPPVVEGLARALVELAQVGVVHCLETRRVEESTTTSTRLASPSAVTQSPSQPVTAVLAACEEGGPRRWCVRSGARAAQPIPRGTPCPWCVPCDSPCRAHPSRAEDGPRAKMLRTDEQGALCVVCPRSSPQSPVILPPFACYIVVS